jgi:hypothetical protein
MTGDTPEVELQPWALRQFERAFEKRDRAQASRADIWYGYRAALIDLRAWSQFRVKPEVLP